MKNTALITGASGGIGMELAKIHASKGGDLVLIARNKIKLTELKTELENIFKVKVYIIAKDLSVVNSAEEVYEETTKLNIKIDYLINNAGFGMFGMFNEAQWEKELQMINLNITTLVYFTKLYLNDMINRRSGRIMNVASTAAFQPGPYMAIYYATKAFVLSFSEAVNHEIRNTGITVTALCPGATESGFQTAASMEESNLVMGKKLPTSEAVAKYGYQAMLNGKAVAIHGLINKIFSTSVRFLPRSLVVKITGKIQERRE